MLLLARYVLPVSHPHIEDGAVLVRDGAIVALGDRVELMRDHPDEEVVDYGLAALMPGFVDLHTHMEYTIFRGVVDDLPYTEWKMAVQGREHLLTEQDWADSAVLGAIEAIRSGITTVADITDSGASVLATQDSGLRGVLYREVSTMDTASVDRVMAEALADIDDWTARTDGSRITIGIAPHSPYTCHPRLFQALVAEVERRDRPVSARSGLPRAVRMVRPAVDAHWREPGALRLPVGDPRPAQRPRGPLRARGCRGHRCAETHGHRGRILRAV